MKKLFNRLKRGFIQLLIIGFVLQVSGALGLGLAVQAVHASSSTVVINEVLPNADMAGTDWDGDGTSLEYSDEWIELYNVSSSPQNISGWKLSNNTKTYTIPNTPEIVSEGKLVIFGSASGNAIQMGNIGDTLILKNVNDEEIDKFTYSATIVNDNSLGRKYDGVDSDNDTNDWVAFNNTPAGGYPTPGESNVPLIRFVVPASLVYTNQNTYTISGEATENRAVRIKDSAGVELAGVPSNSPQTSNAITGAFSFTVNLVANQTNSFNLTVENGTQAVSASALVQIAHETAVPASTIATTGFYGPNTWLGAITGTASDATSGVYQTKISVQRLSDNSYWNGLVWQVVSSELTATGTNNWSYAFDKANLTDSISYKIKAEATDNAGNTKAASTATFVYDSQAPTGTITINVDKTVTHSQNVVLTIAGYDATAGVSEMRISEDPTFSGVAWENFSASKNFTLSSGSGDKQVYLQLEDKAGNVSIGEIYQGITYIAGLLTSDINPPVTDILVAGEMLDAKISFGAEMTPANTMVGTAFGSISTYKTNPGESLLLQGLVAVGERYYDFSLDEPTAFPATIRIYFTQDDLDKSGIVDENQIVGLYYYDLDSTSWKMFEGKISFVNIDGYQGFVEANVSHLTPIVIGADVFMPERPGNTKAEQGKNQVKLSWSKVSDATAYFVRYREKTSSDSSAYTQVEIIGADTTSAVISSLTAGKEYEFGVASIDGARNASEFSVVVQSTEIEVAQTVATTSASKVVLAESPTIYTRQSIVESEPSASQPSSISAIATPQEQPQEIKEVKGEEEQSETEATESDRRRLIVALVILAVAIAAGIGGYYVYEWWVSQPEEEEVSSKKKGKDNGRW